MSPSPRYLEVSSNLGKDVPQAHNVARLTYPRRKIVMRDLYFLANYITAPAGLIFSHGAGFIDDGSVVLLHPNFTCPHLHDNSKSYLTEARTVPRLLILLKRRSISPRNALEGIPDFRHPHRLSQNIPLNDYPIDLPISQCS